MCVLELVLQSVCEVSEVVCVRVRAMCVLYVSLPPPFLFNFLCVCLRGEIHQPDQVKCVVA